MTATSVGSGVIAFPKAGTRFHKEVERYYRGECNDAKGQNLPVESVYSWSVLNFVDFIDVERSCSNALVKGAETGKCGFVGACDKWVGSNGSSRKCLGAVCEVLKYTLAKGTVGKSLHIHVTPTISTLVYHNPSECQDSGSGDEACGIYEERRDGGSSVSGSLVPNVCGRTVGWAGAHTACGSTVKERENFPNDFPYYCSNLTRHGTFEQVIVHLSHMSACNDIGIQKI